MYIKHFSHNDTDGLSAILVSLFQFGKQNVDYVLCTNQNRNKLIKQYIESKKYLQYDYCYITDLNVNEDIVSLIEQYGLQDHFSLYDHHASALWLNAYSWCQVVEEHNGFKPCGASLYYEAMCEQVANDHKSPLNAPYFKTFIEHVRKYDVWEWVSYDDPTPSYFALLIEIYGISAFIRVMYDYLEQNFKKDPLTFALPTDAVTLIQLKGQEKQRYIDGKLKTVYETTHEGYTIGVVFSEKYKSELGNRICEVYPYLDFSIIIDMTGSMSFRTQKDNVNVCKVAESFGGGGHLKAAGSLLNPKTKEWIIEHVLTTELRI